MTNPAQPAYDPMALALERVERAHQFNDGSSQGHHGL
jgi:hypothetical protein